MKQMIYFLLVATLISCASSYEAVKPSQVQFENFYEANQIRLAYEYDILKRKYAKKESRKQIKLVALELQNHSPNRVLYDKDFTLQYENGDKVELVETTQAIRKLKQTPYGYLGYLLLTPVTFFYDQQNGFRHVDSPSGLLLGSVITTFNLTKSIQANSSFKEELLNYTVEGLQLEPGETKYVIIALKGDENRELQITF